MAKLRSVFPSEAATASHLDGNKLTRSLGNAPSALNEKQKNCVFFFFFSLLSFLCSLPSALEAARGPSGGGVAEKRVGPPLAASFGDLWRPLLGSLLSSFFSLRSSLFSLLSSLFSLSSWSSEASIPPLDSWDRGLARPRRQGEERREKRKSEERREKREERRKKRR